MSLPQTACAAPPGAHTSVNVSPSLPFSNAALASQVVGVPEPAEDGGAEREAFELSGEVLVWPPPPALFSFLIFEQPPLPSTMAATRNTTKPPMISSTRTR